MIASSVVAAGFLTGMDNMGAGTAIGMVRLRRGRRVQFAMAFGVAETIAPLLGAAAGTVVAVPLLQDPDALSSLVLATCGAGMLSLLALRRDPRSFLDTTWAPALLALALSFDNFVLGLGLGSSGTGGLPRLVGVGAVCAAMSALGLYIGSAIRPTLPRTATVSAAILLCVTAIVGLGAGA